MKNMKKVMLIFFVITELLLMTSCGNSDEENKIADEERKLDSLMSLTQTEAP